MKLQAKIIAVLGLVLFISLTGIAGYAYTQTRLLSLPLPQALSLFTVLLPLLIGLSTRFIQLLLHPSTFPTTRSPARPTLAILGILTLQTIYETVIVTLALTYVLPSELTICGLEKQWKHLFRTKNEGRIRTIQDTFQCCGFRTSKDMPWPFPNKSTDAGECMRRLGSNKSCQASWRGAEQRNGGLLLMVALIVFLLKIVAVLSIFDSARSRMPRWMKFFDQMITGSVNSDQGEHHPRAVTRGLIEEGLESPTQDLIDAAGAKDVDDDTQPEHRDHLGAIVPSSLNADSEWDDRR